MTNEESTAGRVLSKALGPFAKVEASEGVSRAWRRATLATTLAVAGFGLAGPNVAVADALDNPARPPAPPPPPPAPPAMPPSITRAPKGASTDKAAAPSDAPRKVPLPAHASPKRALPDYDGRGPKPATVGDGLLWVPRVVFSPVYFTTEYLIREPIGALVSAAERSNVPQVLYDFFLFGPDHKAGVVPTIFFDFGFSPSVGLLGFWNDAGFKRNNLSAHFSIWTSDWIAGSVGDSIGFGKASAFAVKLAALRRPDRTFFGIGANSLQGNLSRYGETRLEGSGTFDVPLWHSSQLQAGSGYRTVNLYNGDYGGDPTVTDEVLHGAYAAPPGFGTLYAEEFNHALIALDTRSKRVPSGVRLEAQAEQGSDLRQSLGAGWIRYQGTAGVFLDLNGTGRVVSLSATALFADPLEPGGVIPFTEQVSLGGNTPILSALASGTGLMPGLYTGRLVDRSAAVATLQYRWPIWAFLDGTLQVATGNVFGEHLDELKPSLLRFSGAMGIESNGASDSAIHLLIGIGSETFDRGGQIDSLRLAFGTSRF